MYILEVEAWDIFRFLWIGYYAVEHLGRGGLGVKAFSVSVSVCALYTSVCVYASVSYRCLFPRSGCGNVFDLCECATVSNTATLFAQRRARCAFACFSSGDNEWRSLTRLITLTCICMLQPRVFTVDGHRTAGTVRARRAGRARLILLWNIKAVKESWRSGWGAAITQRAAGLMGMKAEFFWKEKIRGQYFLDMDVPPFLLNGQSLSLHPHPPSLTVNGALYAWWQIKGLTTRSCDSLEAGGISVLSWSHATLSGSCNLVTLIFFFSSCHHVSFWLFLVSRVICHWSFWSIDRTNARIK